MRLVVRVLLVCSAMGFAACRRDPLAQGPPTLGVVSPPAPRPRALAAIAVGSRVASTTPDAATFVGPIGDGTGFAAVSNITIIGDRLIVADQLTDPHLSVVDWKTGSARRFVGRHGLGFEQLIDPICLQGASETPPVAWVYDFTQRRLVLMQLNVGVDSPVRESIPIKPDHVACALWAGGRIVAIAQGHSSPAILILDRNGNELTRIATPLGDSSALIPSAIVVRPDQRRMAVAYRGADQVDVFHPSGVRDTSFGVVAGESGGTIRAQAVSIIALAGSARFVYALIGRKPMDAMPSIGTEIVVSTWDGAPAQAIHLAYPIHSFAVSDDDQELFGSYFASDNASPLIGHWHIGPTALSGAQAALTDAVAERRQCEAAASLKCSLLQAPDRTVKY